MICDFASTIGACTESTMCSLWPWLARLVVRRSVCKWAHGAVPSSHIGICMWGTTCQFSMILRWQSTLTVVVVCGATSVQFHTAGHSPDRAITEAYLLAQVRIYHAGPALTSAWQVYAKLCHYPRRCRPDLCMSTLFLRS